MVRSTSPEDEKQIMLRPTAYVLPSEEEIQRGLREKQARLPQFLSD